MSRSRKKNPVIAIDYNSKRTRWSKSQASRKVRRYKGSIPDGGGFKKIFETWDIIDVKYRCSINPEDKKYPEKHIEFKKVFRK